MRILSLISALLVVGNTAVAAWGADLTRIDRTIHHEPAYQSKAPKYCLLVFGPSAQTRVWLVVDGKSLLVDEQGKGDLRTAKRVELSSFGAWFKAGKIQVASKLTRYTSGGDWFYDTKEHWLRISLKTSDDWSYTAIPRLADQPRKAPVVHLGGPLTMSLGRHAPKSLKPGDMVNLAPMIGTPGLGEGAFAIIRSLPGVAELSPQADIECPPKLPGAPLKTSVKFKWCECCGGIDPGHVPIPAEAGQGTAKITLSFPGWKGGKVTPAVLEVPMVDTAATPK